MWFFLACFGPLAAVELFVQVLRPSDHRDSLTHKGDRVDRYIRFNNHFKHSSTLYRRDFFLRLKHQSWFSGRWLC